MTGCPLLGVARDSMRAVNLAGVPRMGVARTRWTVVVAFATGLVALDVVATASAQPLATDRVQMERTGCLGICPHYTVTLYAQGRMTLAYEGINDLNVRFRGQKDTIQPVTWAPWMMRRVSASSETSIRQRSRSSWRRWIVEGFSRFPTHAR